MDPSRAGSVAGPKRGDFRAVLGEYGYAETALRIFAQPEYPGWEWQRRKGATTIWEDFKGVNSHNHVIFGDPSAWAFRYLGGIRFRDGKAEKVEPLRPISGGFFKATCRGLAVSRGGVAGRLTNAVYFPILLA